MPRSLLDRIAKPSGTSPLIDRVAKKSGGSSLLDRVGRSREQDKAEADGRVQRRFESRGIPMPEADVDRVPEHTRQTVQDQYGLSYEEYADGRETAPTRNQEVIEKFKPAARVAGTPGKYAQGDGGASLVKGVGMTSDLAGSVYGLLSGDMNNPLTRFGESAQEKGQSMKSDELLAREERRQTAVNEADGFMAKLGTTIKETATDPALFASFILEQAPNLLLAGGAGRAVGSGAKALGASGKTAARSATAGTVGTAATMQGGDAGSEAYDRLMNEERWALMANEAYQELINEGKEPEQAKHEVALELSRLAAAKSAAVSVGVNLLPAARSLDRVLAGSGKKGAGGMIDMLKGGAKGFAAEGVSEGIEEGYGVRAANVAAGEVNRSQDAMEGVAQATGMGAMFAPLGGISGLAEGAGSRGSAGELDLTNPQAPQQQPQPRPAEDFSIEGAVDQTMQQPVPSEQPTVSMDGQPVEGANEYGLPRDAAPQAEPTTLTPQTEPTASDPGLTGPVTDQALPENLPDPRLKREPYRGRLQQMTGELIKGGGVTFVPKKGAKPRNRGQLTGDPFYDYSPEDLVRTGSQNPGWFQSIAQDHGVTTDGVKRAVQKALEGKKLGKRQAAAVEAMIDHVQSERAYGVTPDGEPQFMGWRDMLHEFRQQQKADGGQEQAGDRTLTQRYADEDYLEDMEQADRLLYDLAQGAAAVDEAAAIEEIQAGHDETETIRRLWEIGQRGEDGQRDAGVPAEQGQGAQEPGAQPRPDAEAEAGQAEGFALEGEVAPETQTEPQEQQADAFEAPTESQQGAEQRRQEVDDRLQGQGSPDMLQGEGELFAGPRPEQADAFGDSPVDRAAQDTETNPTDAQIEAGNYRKGKTRLHGMEISIENPRGSTRSGTDGDGNRWESEMAHHYGYIKRTNGADGEQVDVFIGPDAENTDAPVFIIDQIDPETGNFDEHKIMLGFADEAAAREGYEANYADGWQGLGDIRQMDVQGLKDWLATADTTKPAAMERREDDGRRRRVEEMSPEEMRRALLVDDLTGLGNRRAFNEAMEDHDGPVVSIDADSLKWINDNMSPDVGDQLLQKVGQAIQQHAGEGQAFHISGDEFYILPESGRDIDALMDAINADLAGVELKYEHPDGSLFTKTGAEITYGQGQTKQSADRRVKSEKSARESRGERAARGETPRGVRVSRQPAGVPADDGARRQADRDAAERPPVEESPPDQPAQESTETPPDGGVSRSGQEETIEDFGEELLGARKHLYEQLEDARDQDTAEVPLSKSWPEPNYNKLVDDGIDPFTVALVRALRDEVPPKPRKAGRLSRWAAEVDELRDAAIRMLRDPEYAQEFRNEVGHRGGLGRVSGRAELYQRFGHEKSLKGIRFEDHHFSLYKGEENVTKWVIEKKAKSTAFSNWPRELAVGNTKEEALENFAAVYASLGNKTRKRIRFDIYQDRATRDYFIGKKIGRNVVRIQEGFDSLEEARTHLNTKTDELEQKLAKLKDIPDHRKRTNAPRVGGDHRNGQDATPELWEETFGFRGVQFGNWVEQHKRQKDLNQAFDALMDLAAVINVPAKALSLNGELGLAFGARGRGGQNPAAAHFEPDSLVINLTKKEGAGSLAHEWWHALDNYFARRKGNAGKLPFVTETPGRPAGDIRPEVAEAFKRVVSAINASGMPRRAKKLDKVRSKDYWSTARELSARTFESYVIAKLQDHNGANDYLANVIAEEAWDAAAAMGMEKEGSYPYPTKDEMPEIRAAFDSFWQTVETRETDQGVELYRRGQQGAGTTPEAFRAAFTPRAQRTLFDSGLVTVTESPADWPGDHPADAAGVWMGDRIYLATDNIRPGAERALILHEVGVHHGLKDMLGGEYDSLVSQLQKQVERGARERAARSDREAYQAHQRALADETIAGDETALWEETIAYMAEAGADTPLLKRIATAVRRFLRRLGLVRDFTNADISDLARGSVQRVIRGDESGQSVYAPESAAYARAGVKVPNRTWRWMGFENPQRLVADFDHLAQRHPEHYETAGDVRSDVEFVMRNPDDWFLHADDRVMVVRKGNRPDVPAVRIDFRRTRDGALQIASVYRMTERGIVSKMRGKRKRVDEALGGSSPARGLPGRTSPGSLTIRDYLEVEANRSGRPESPSGDSASSDESVSPDEDSSQSGGKPRKRYSRTESGFVADPANPDQPARPGKEIFSTTVYLGRDSSGKAITVQTSDPSLKEQGKLKQYARKLFTKEGLLNPQSFARHIETHGIKNADELDVQFFTADLIKKAKKTYGKVMYDAIPQAEREKMNEYLAGEKVEGLHKDVRDSLDVMRGSLDRMSGRLVTMIGDEIRFMAADMDQEQRATFLDNFNDAMAGDEDALAEIEALPHGEQIARRMRLIETVEGNKGHYLNRSYRVFDEDNWRPDADVIERAREFLAEQVDSDPEFSGLPDKEKADHVEGIINSILGNRASSLVGFFSSGMLGRKDLSILKRRKEIAPEIRALMGEHTDPRLNFARSMTKMSYLVANHHFLAKVREDGLGHFLSTRQSGTMSEQIAEPGDPTMLPLSGLYSTPEFAQALRDYVTSKPTEGWLRMAYGVNASIKYGKTVLSPTTSFRNFWSASMFTVMNGHFNLRHSLRAAQHTWADLASRNMSRHAYIHKLAKLGVLHDNPRASELEAAMDDAMDMDPNTGGLIKRTAKAPLNLATKIYRAGDDFWKIIGFENEKASLIKHGVSEAEAETMAAERIRDGYPTYSMVPEGIRWLRRFPLAGTFVSFPWEIIRTTGSQFKMVRQDFEAGRTTMAAKRALGMAVAGANTYVIGAILMSMFGVDDEEDEAIRSLAAPWQRNAQFAYMPPDDEGNVRYLDLSHLDPYAYLKLPLEAIMNGNNETVAEKAGQALKEMLEPFIGSDIAATALVDVWKNSKEGTDAPIYDEAATPVEKGKRVFDYLREALQPGIFANVERTLKAVRGEVTSYGKRYDKSDEALGWIGFRLTTSEPEVSLKFRSFDFLDDYRQAMSPIYRTLRNPNPIDDDEIREAVQRADGRWENAFQELHSAIRAAKVSGLTDNELAGVLADARVPKKHIRPLVNLDTPQWEPTQQGLDSAYKAAVGGKNTRITHKEFIHRRDVLKEEIRRVRQE